MHFKAQRSSQLSTHHTVHSSVPAVWLQECDERLQRRPRSSQDSTSTGCDKGNPDQIKGKPSLTVGWLRGETLEHLVSGDAHNTVAQGPEQPDLREPCPREGMDQMDERHPDRFLSNRIILWSILWCMY